MVAAVSHDLLSQSGLFSRLSLVDRERLASYLDRISVPAGQVVVRQGDEGRDMFLIISGQASIVRGDIELGSYGPGDHFGELALVSGRQRAATIAATSDLALARLSLDHYHDIASQHPALALSLVRSLVSHLGIRLGDMTESVGNLLRERSLPRRIYVDVNVMGVMRTVRVGTTIGDLMPKEVDERIVVAALVNNAPVALTTLVSADCRIEPLTTGHWEGRRVYRQSLALLLLEAAQRVDPAIELRIGVSIGFAVRIHITDARDRDLAELARALHDTMLSIASEDVVLRAEFWTVDEARSYLAEHGQTDAVALLATWREATAPLVSYGSSYVLQLGPLVDTSAKLTGFRVVSEKQDLVLVFGEEADGGGVADPSRSLEAVASVSRHAESLVGKHSKWLDALGVDSVGALNLACLSGDVGQLVRVAEGFHEKRIGSIADAIRKRPSLPRVVCVAGPSSSGKTTFIRRLKVQLQVVGLRPLGLSLDDYYLDRDQTPRDDAGELDYEAFGALQHDLLQTHLKLLLAGEEVQTAHYDFRVGVGHPSGGPTLRLDAETILLVEGIHGLNPRLVDTLPAQSVFRIFICPLAQLPFDRATRMHASDLRLLRRLVRDRHGRGANATDTIVRWPSVRRGERIHIFPHQIHADAVFDSSLIYEVSVLRSFAERYLLEVSRDRPEFATARRLLSLLDRFVTIDPGHVPEISLLREFVGGGAFGL